MARAVTGERSFIERARREQIVTAAIDVLYESGFAAASLGAIAERIGVSKGVISYHFTGKDEVLSEVMAHVLAEGRAYMVPRIRAAGSYREALRIYLTSNLEYIGANRRKIMAFIEILNGSPPAGTGTAPWDEGRQTVVDELRDLLAAGQAAGEFGEFSASVAAVSIRASIDVLSILLRADPEMDTAAYAADLLRLYERGVQA